jgi:hypothetical protein
MATVTSVELVWAPVRGGLAPIMDRYAANTAAVYSRVKVAANASSWPLSARGWQT